MEQIKRRLFWGSICVASLFLGWLLQGVLTPFLVSFLLAYLLGPLVSGCERHGLPRWVTSFILMIVFFALVFTFFFVLVPFLESKFRALICLLPSYGEQFLEALKPILEWAQPYNTIQNSVQIQTMIADSFKEIVSGGLQFIINLLTSGVALVQLLAFLIFAPLMTFYFLKDWQRICTKFLSLIPLKTRPRLLSLLSDIDRSLGGYARGQLLVCSVLAVYYIIFLSLIGLSFPVLLGFLSGFLIFIPYVGFLTALMVSCSVAFTAPDVGAMLIKLLGVYGVGNMLEGFLLTPQLVGKRTGLHPLWILFALFASGTLLGITGMILCLPLAAILRVCTTWLVSLYQKSSYYRDDPAL